MVSLHGGSRRRCNGIWMTHRPAAAQSGAGEPGRGAIAWRVVAAGAGWRVTDVRCGAGPGDRPYEERHDTRVSRR